MALRQITNPNIWFSIGFRKTSVPSLMNVNLYQIDKRRLSTDTFQESKTRSGAVQPVEDLFINPQVQQLLRELTGCSLEKIFKRRQLGKIQTSQISLLTDEELQKAKEMKLNEVGMNLQMPPIMSERKPCEEVLEENPDLENFDQSRHVFVDITFGVKPRERYMVVRERTGVLRTLSWEERDKMNQIYFPNQDRCIDFPAVFIQENLVTALERDFHEYLLDRACVQFEPDDSHFIRVCHTVYESINNGRKFSTFESTRHMGGLIFYLALQNKLDNYIIYLLQNDRMDNVGNALRLYYLLHQDNSNQFNAAMTDSIIAALKYYMHADGLERGNLELALQAYQENLRRQQDLNVEDRLKMKAHN